MGNGGGGWLAKVRNGIAYFTQHRNWIQEGYKKVNCLYPTPPPPPPFQS